VLDGAEPIVCRPGDLLGSEVDRQTEELSRIAAEKGIRLATDVIDDVLTYALFPQIGIKFLENRDNPGAFEPLPDAAAAKPPVASGSTTEASVYSVRINGKSYTVEVAESGQLSSVQPADVALPAPSAVSGDAVKAVLAGNIFKVHVQPGDIVEEGQPLIVVEAMKMETAIVAPRAGTITGVFIAEGDAVAVGDQLVAIG
jgi:oxaloacetate decarboxylase alpha subunit